MESSCALEVLTEQVLRQNPECLAQLETSYEDELLKLKAALEEDLSHRHNLVYSLCTHGYYEDKDNTFGAMMRIINATNRLRAKTENPDFTITPLIRVLFANEREIVDTRECASPQSISLAEAKSLILHNLAEFQFWPKPNKEQNKKMENITFWSENHLFMTLGSAFLLQEFLDAGDLLGAFPFAVAERMSGELKAMRVKDLLSVYLTAHLHGEFAGLYEVQSVVYLQFTVFALLNLVDLAGDRVIADQAERLLDIVVEQLMRGTDPLCGVANLSATARHYPRVTERNTKFALNTLIRLLNRGHCSDAYEPTYLSSAMALTRRWRPKRSAFLALHAEGAVCEVHRCSHDLRALLSLYDEIARSMELTEEEITPLLWSAGLLLHPRFVARNRRFVLSRGLAALHGDLRVFAEAAPGVALSENTIAPACRAFRHFSQGQQYAEIYSNVFKAPRQGLVLSSFELLNPHYCAFQQLPWAVSLCGVPLFSQAGHGKVAIELVLKGRKAMRVFEQPSTNTHSPAVRQRRDVVLVSYLAHDCRPRLKKTSLWSLAFDAVKKRLNAHVHLFWPEAFLEEQRSFPYVDAHKAEDERRVESEAAEQFEATHCGQEREEEREGEEDCESAAEDEELRALRVDLEDNDNDNDEDDDCEYFSAREENEENGAQQTDEDAPENPSPAAGTPCEALAALTEPAPAVSASAVSAPVEIEASKPKGSKKAKGSVWKTVMRKATKTIKQIEKTSGELQQAATTSATHIMGEVSKATRRRRRNNAPPRDEETSPEAQRWHWRVGRRGGCFVALLSTKALNISDAEVTRKTFTLGHETHALTTLQSTARQVSLVVVVGTVDEYPTMQAFFEAKLQHIVVVEYVKDGQYHVLVNDTTLPRNILLYRRNAMSPLS